MKRFTCILLILLFLLGSLTGCGTAKPEDDPAEPESRDAEQEIPAEAEYIEDFTVQTIDGSQFTLSEELKDHEFVLINLFATWCGPCQMEFPYMQEAWTQRSDQVSVIALSVDPEDSDELLTQFAETFGLGFPVAGEVNDDIMRFCDGSIPTTIIVDRSRKVVEVDVGAKTSTQEFLDLFDGFTSDSYDPETSTYTVNAFNSDTYEDIEGVVVNFCTDITCTPVTTDAAGVAYFTGPSATYHVQVISWPEGLKVDEGSGYDQTDFYTEPFNQTFYLAFTGE